MTPCTLRHASLVSGRSRIATRQYYFAYNSAMSDSPSTEQPAASATTGITTSTVTSNAPQLDDGMLATFICPVTRSKLTQDGNHLVSEVGGLRYPWQEGIWRLIADQAELPEGIESLEDFKQKFADQIPD